ncbi:type II secretion system protein [bacterium]|nr:type II secretion system protein [bacterium]
MKFKSKAFTLTELLVALGIIGAIAAMSIPSLMNHINRQTLTTQLKGLIGSFQQLTTDQMVKYKTKSLTNTDFTDPAKLLTEENFAMAQDCGDTTAGAKNCWKTSATGTAKIQYRLLSNTNTGIAGPGYKSIILKNGAIVGYRLTSEDLTDGDKMIGEFCYDINGNEPPNMSGRDYFCTFVTSRGKLIDTADGTTLTVDEKIRKCTEGHGANYCYGATVDSGWKMTY